MGVKCFDCIQLNLPALTRPRLPNSAAFLVTSFKETPVAFTFFVIGPFRRICFDTFNALCTTDDVDNKVPTKVPHACLRHRAATERDLDRVVLDLLVVYLPKGETELAAHHSL